MRGSRHGRCRLNSCSCAGHDQDVRDKAAALVGEYVPGCGFVAPTLTIAGHPKESGQDIVPAPPLTMPIHAVADEVDRETALWDAVKSSALSALRVSTEATGLDQLDAETCMRILYALRAGLEHLRDVEAGLVNRIYLAGPHGMDVRVEGLPPAIVGRSKNRKGWDERGAAFAYLDSKMAARDGEAPDPGEVVDWMLELFGVNYVRTTPLKAVGLQVDAFCEETPGKPQVSFIQ